jgi:hypothetical protein
MRRSFFEGRLVPVAQGPFKPACGFSVEFQPKGKPAVGEPLTIDHPRVRMQFAVAGLDQHPLVEFARVSYQHAQAQRADVFCGRAFSSSWLLQTADAYGHGQSCPFFQSSRPYRHLMTHLAGCLRYRYTGLDGAERPNDSAQNLTINALRKSRHPRCLK